jgi:hypothetical protein
LCYRIDEESRADNNTRGRARRPKASRSSQSVDEPCWNDEITHASEAERLFCSRAAE